MIQYSTVTLPDKVNYRAPDGSETRLLVDGRKGGLSYARLPVSKTASAIFHRTVDELWFCLSGEGEVCRKLHGQEEVTKVASGVSLSLPQGTVKAAWRTRTKMPPWNRCAIVDVFVAHPGEHPGL
jgi:hypothetical protein